MIRLAAIAALLTLGGACRAMPTTVDPMDAVSTRESGLPVLSLRWRFMVADRTMPGWAIGLSMFGS